MWAPRIQKAATRVGAGNDAGEAGNDAGDAVGGGAIETPARRYVARKVAIMITFERLPCHLDLALVTHAYHGFGFGFGFGQHRQQHRCKNANDGDHHQEFNESEASGFRSYEFFHRS